MVLTPQRRRYISGRGHLRRQVPRGLWAGILLIAAGLYLLLVNLGLTWWWDWTIGGPALLIAAGILLLLRRVR